MSVLPLNRHKRNIKFAKLLGRYGMAQNDKPLYIIGKQLGYIVFFGFGVVVARKDDEFVTELLVSAYKSAENIGIIMQIKIGNNNADYFGFSVRQNFCEFVFFVIQFFKCVGNLCLILFRKRIGVVEISRHCGL